MILLKSPKQPRVSRLCTVSDTAGVVEGRRIQLTALDISPANVLTRTER
ncbi:MAG: hypothetical protein P4L44_01090 [Oryzomonas sp.]|nr:hypothetical protein [Oryzomonas sp.]MDR3578536.1 hypothetical protein [Oryzomonas sp.]